MKSECPRCQTVDKSVPYSRELQQWVCVCCGHEFIVPPGPPPIPVPECYRVCEQCCRISPPKEKLHEITAAFVALAILIITGTGGFLLIGYAGFAVALVLFAIYIICWAIQKPFVCTECGTPNMVKMTSPRGIEIIEHYNLRTWTEPPC